MIQIKKKNMSGAFASPWDPSLILSSLFLPQSNYYPKFCVIFLHFFTCLPPMCIYS